MGKRSSVLRSNTGEGRENGVDVESGSLVLWGESGLGVGKVLV